METLGGQAEATRNQGAGQSPGDPGTPGPPEFHSLARALETAREELRSLTGLRLSTTVGTSRSGKGWCIALEMVEKASVPDSMDLLATYEAQVDWEGHVIEFKRKGLRKRMDPDERKGI